MIAKLALASLLLAATASCGDIPDNVRAFYNSVKSQGQCKDVLASGFYAKESAGPGTLHLCHWYLNPRFANN